jgi:16S rRNA (guanine966-N2)-methyltransferase
MARVIAGEAGGRRLAVPDGRDTRPTSDRAREGLFATIVSLTGSLDGARVLDLYAGSGAVGLEALSRGAEHVLLVESGTRAARVIRANIEAIGLPGAEVITDRVERVLARRPDHGRYDVVFADPPYALADDEVSAMLQALSDHGWLVPGALVIIERATRSGPFSWPPGFEPDRARRYGEATFWYARAPYNLLAEPGSGGSPGGRPPGRNTERGGTTCTVSSVRVPLIPLPTGTSTSSAAPPGYTTR